MHPQQSPDQKRKAAIKAFGRYGGLAFQLFAACFAGVWLGRRLDAYLGLERATWSVFLTVLFMLASLYVLYKQLLRDP